MRPTPDQLKTTADFLDELKDLIRERNPDMMRASDADAARLLRITTASISRHRQLKSTFDDDTARRVAELLDYDPAYVFVCAHAQGAQNPAVRSIWARMAKHATAATVVAGLLGALLPLMPQRADAGQPTKMYIMLTALFTLLTPRRRLALA